MFELAATIGLGFVTAIWSQDGIVNIGIKCAFLGLALWGAVETSYVLDLLPPKD